MDDFAEKVRRVTGMTMDELAWWGEREEFERQEYARAAGSCCSAGVVAAPDPCPWHPDHRQPTAGAIAGYLAERRITGRLDERNPK